jgi:hypothetical protein
MRNRREIPSPGPVSGSVVIGLFRHIPVSRISATDLEKTLIEPA